MHRSSEESSPQQSTSQPLPLLAPRDTPASLAVSALPSSHNSRSTREPASRARLTHRSRAGCWTCRARKVKCDELHPRCGPCTRLRRECDWDHRWHFNDATASTQTRYVNVLIEGNAVWDPKARSSHSASGSESSPILGNLPPFNTLTNDEDRERVAGSAIPGTFSVVITPDSFANLPEYTTVTSPNEGRRLSMRSSSGGHSNLNPRLARRTLRIDPNVVILDHFDDNSGTPTTPTFDWPSRRASVPDLIHHISLALAPASRSVTYPPSPIDNHADLQLLGSFRRHIAYRIIPQALDTTSADYMTSRTVRDMFDAESTRFPPLRHAMCALSALNLYYLGQARFEDATHHYQKALSQASDEDVRSDGSLLRHFLLFLYDISITWYSQSEEANMWATNLRALQSIIAERARLFTIEPHPYTIWLICNLDMHASLLGNGDCSFFRDVIRLGKLPQPAQQIPGDLCEASAQCTSGDLLTAVLELNQAIVIQTAKIAHAAHGFRLEFGTRTRNTPELLEQFQAQISAMRKVLVEFWTRFCPSSLEPVSAHTGRSLAPRVRAVFESALVLFHAVIIYTRTSMFPEQRLLQSPGQDNLTADTEARVDVILGVADHMVNEQSYDQRFIMFPIFMAGYVTKQSDSKVHAIGLLKAFEGSGIGRNTATTRKLLRAVCEEQSRCIDAHRPVEEVDWLRVLVKKGLRIINCGL